MRLVAFLNFTDFYDTAALADFKKEGGDDLSVQSHSHSLSSRTFFRRWATRKAGATCSFFLNVDQAKEGRPATIDLDGLDHEKLRSFSRS